MALRRTPPDLEEWEVIRYKYEWSDLTIPEICAEHRISDGTLRDRVRRWGWKRRRAPIPRQGPPSRLPPPEANDAPAAAPAEPGADLMPLAPAPNAAPPDDTPLPLRLQRAVAHELAAIETTIARSGALRSHAGASDRTARALATLTRTLRELNTLQTQRPEPIVDADRSPDIDERRLALIRKIDALVASREDGAGDEPEPA